MTSRIWRPTCSRRSAAWSAIAKASSYSDGQTVKVQLNDVREKSMEVRVLMDARNAEEAAALRAEIREKVIDWLRAELPEAMPRNGVEFAPPAAPPPTAAP